MYEALMTEREKTLLENRLREVINHQEDQVMFIDMGSPDRGDGPEIATLGVPYRALTRGSVVF
jgi:CRISPR-associated protein Cas2